MKELGAAADNADRRWSAGRRRALRKSPRAPGPPLPSSIGSRKLGAEVGRSQGRPKGADRKAPGASRRSIPLVWGKRKTGTKGPPRGPKSNPRDSEALVEGG